MGIIKGPIWEVEYPWSIVSNHTSYEYNKIIQWMLNTFGNSSEDVDWTVFGNYPEYYWYFKLYDDIILFRLTWIEE